MFGFNSINEISQLEEYLSTNDVIYEQPLIKKEFDDFDEKYSVLNAKCGIGLPDYAQYTDFYVNTKKNEMLTNLFKEYPGMNTWARSLKVAALKLDKRIISNSGMVLGYYSDRLLPSEILHNEEKARQYLTSLRIKESANSLYKKK